MTFNEIMKHSRLIDQSHDLYCRLAVALNEAMASDDLERARRIYAVKMKASFRFIRRVKLAPQLAKV